MHNEKMYKAKAQKLYDQIMNSDIIEIYKKKQLIRKYRITEANKDTLQKYLDLYESHHSSVDLSILLECYKRVCQYSKNLIIEMKDKQQMGSIFMRIGKDYSPATYNTTLKRIRRFLTRLNDDDLPAGFKIIKAKSSKEEMRGTTSSDTLTWQDGLALVGYTNSIQWQALIMVELEAGLRPAELCALNFGDVRRQDKFFILLIKDTKTKENREVIIWAASPYLAKWVNAHPTQKPESPLWCQEFLRRSQKGSVVRYRQAAITGRIKDLARDAGITKPVYLYNFRHSSCVIKKMQGWETSEACLSMGHTERYFNQVYGRLAISERLEKFDELIARQTGKKAEQAPIQCHTCNFINAAGADYCEQCRSPLSLKVAMHDRKDSNKQIARELLELIKQEQGDDALTRVAEAISWKRRG